MNETLIKFLKRGYDYSCEALQCFYCDGHKESSLGFINAADTAITAAELISADNKSQLLDDLFNKFHIYQFALLNDFSLVPQPDLKLDSIFGDFKDVYDKLFNI